MVYRLEDIRNHGLPRDHKEGCLESRQRAHRNKGREVLRNCRSNGEQEEDEDGEVVRMSTANNLSEFESKERQVTTSIAFRDNESIFWKRRQTNRAQRPPDKRGEPHGQQNASIADAHHLGPRPEFGGNLRSCRQERCTRESRSQSHPTGGEEDQDLAPCWISF